MYVFARLLKIVLGRRSRLPGAPRPPAPQRLYVDGAFRQALLTVAAAAPWGAPQYIFSGVHGQLRVNVP